MGHDSCLTLIQNFFNFLIGTALSEVTIKYYICPLILSLFKTEKQKHLIYNHYSKQWSPYKSSNSPEYYSSDKLIFRASNYRGT